MKNIFLILIVIFVTLINAQNLFAQSAVDVFLGYDLPDDVVSTITYENEGIKEDLFYDGEPVYYAYPGYQEFFIGSIPMLVHLEKGDEVVLTGVDFKKSTDFYFIGQQGTAKNNYLNGRVSQFYIWKSNHGYKNLTKQSLENQLDSIATANLDLIKELQLSYDFFKDEFKYFQIKKDLELVKYNLIKNADNYATPIDSLFAKRNYSDKLLARKYGSFAELSALYHLELINRAVDDKEAKYWFRKVNNKPTEIKLLEFIEEKAYTPGILQARYQELLTTSGKKASGFYQSEFERLEKLKPGTPAPPFQGFNLSGEVFNIQEAADYEVHILFYRIGEPQVDTTLSLWNEIYKERNEKGRVFLTIAVDAGSADSRWQALASNSLVAGLNLRLSQNSTQKLMQDYLISKFPHYIVLDKNTTIKQSKVILTR